MLRRISGLLLAAIVPTGIASPLTLVDRAAAQPTELSAPTVISLLPPNTAAVVMLNTTPAAWRELDRFNPYPGFFPPDFLGPLLQVDMKADPEIQSWIGDRVAIALLPATADTAQWESHAVMIASSRDPLRLRAFVDRFKAQRGQPQIERNYKGVTIIQWSGDKPPSTEPPVPSRVIPKETRLPQDSPILGFSPLDRLKQSQSKPSQPKPSPGQPLVKPAAPRPLPPQPSPPPAEDNSEEPIDPAPIPTPERKSRSVAIALLPNHLIMANQADALETLIDAQSEQSSLAKDPKFQRTLQHPQFGRSLLVGYGNVAGIIPFLAPFTQKPDEQKPDEQKPTDMSLLGLTGQILTGQVLMPLFSVATHSPTSPALKLDPAVLERLEKDYSTIDSLTWVQPQGLRNQTHSYYASPKPEVATLTVPNSNQVLSRVPAATYLSANSYNFKRQWEFFLKTIEADSVTTNALQKFRTEFTKQTQLDLEKDLIAWMDKGYALSMFPSSQGLFNTISPGFNLETGVMIQTSDRPKAEASLKKLAQTAQSASNGSIEIVERTIKGQPIVSWESRDRGKSVSFLSYAWSGDTLIVATGAGAMAAIYPKPYLPLDLNYTFKTATQGFPTPNEGFFYVNMGSSLSLLYNLIFPKNSPAQGSSYVQEIQRVMGIFRSYSTSNSITPDGEQLDSILMLSPRKQP